jgi:hypothetical protein
MCDCVNQFYIRAGLVNLSFLLKEYYTIINFLVWFTGPLANAQRLIIEPFVGMLAPVSLSFLFFILIFEKKYFSYRQAR